MKTIAIILICCCSLSSNLLAQEHQLQAKGELVLLDGFFNHEKKPDPKTGDSIRFHYTWMEKENSGYSKFGDLFIKYGFRTAITEKAPAAATLKQAAVYIIVDPDTKKESPSPNYIDDASIEVLVDWVKQGGILLLFGNDSGNAEFAHFNQLAEKFGIQFQENCVNKVVGNAFEMGSISIPSGNLVFVSGGDVYIKDMSSLKLKRPAQPVLRKAADIVIAVSPFGKGKVFAVGDPWFYNEYLDGPILPANLSNHQAAEDLVRWVIKQLR